LVAAFRKHWQKVARNEIGRPLGSRLSGAVYPHFEQRLLVYAKLIPTSDSAGEALADLPVRRLPNSAHTPK